MDWLQKSKESKELEEHLDFYRLLKHERVIQFTINLKKMKKDKIIIQKNKISFNISFSLKEVDNAFIGYIESFDLHFTSPNQEKANGIVAGLINVLFKHWLKIGGFTLFEEKMNKFGYIINDKGFEKNVSETSNYIDAELLVNTQDYINK